jgi:hypothetical protein
MRARVILSTVFCFLFWFAAAPAGAQLRSRPALASPPAGWWTPATGALAPLRWHMGELLAQERRRRRAPGTVLMIVGGAVAAVGILTDESVLIVGGVVVAAVGLYRYLQ